MYTDGKGNVTLSARDGGSGHVEPTADSTIQAGITLLEGSGVVNGKMIANVKCTTILIPPSKPKADAEQAHRANLTPRTPLPPLPGSQHGIRVLQ